MGRAQRGGDPQLRICFEELVLCVPLFQSAVLAVVPQRSPYTGLFYTYRIYVYFQLQSQHLHADIMNVESRVNFPFEKTCSAVCA